MQPLKFLGAITLVSEEVTQKKAVKDSACYAIENRFCTDKKIHLEMGFAYQVGCFQVTLNPK